MSNSRKSSKDNRRSANRTAGTLIGAGNNGAVFTGGLPGIVWKYTRDPVETQAWLVALDSERRGRPIPGLARVYDVIIRDREAVIIREDVNPWHRGRGPISPEAEALLQRGGQKILAGRLEGRPGLVAAGMRIQRKALTGKLAEVGKAAQMLYKLGAPATDIRLANLGRRSNGEIVILDPGRAPIETLLVAAAAGDPVRIITQNQVPPRRRGRAAKVSGGSCPDEFRLRRAVQEIMGVAPSYKSCKVVSKAQLARTMGSHGWRKNEIAGTAGFHTQDNRIEILEGHEWSILHEMVHAAGVIDRSLAPWLVEGVTEATAQEIARKRGWTHQPTYPHEVRLVTKQLLPKLGMQASELAKFIADNPKTAKKRLAALMGARCGGDPSSWAKVISTRAQSRMALQGKLQSCKPQKARTRKPGKGSGGLIRSREAAPTSRLPRLRRR